jgi:hypothetical protein
LYSLVLAMIHVIQQSKDTTALDGNHLPRPPPLPPYPPRYHNRFRSLAHQRFPVCLGGSISQLGCFACASHFARDIFVWHTLYNLSIARFGPRVRTYSQWDFASAAWSLFSASVLAGCLSLCIGEEEEEEREENDEIHLVWFESRQSVRECLKCFE